MSRRRAASGLSLVEVLIGIGLGLIVMIAVVPVFVNELVMNNVYWEHRLAMRAIDAQLDKACQDVAGLSVFGTAPSLPIPNPAPITDPLPPELGGATGTVEWEYVNPVTLASAGAAPSTIAKITTTISWTSKGHVMQRSGDALISTLGLCKII